jgi:hypothetical protein
MGKLGGDFVNIRGMPFAFSYGTPTQCHPSPKLGFSCAKRHSRHKKERRATAPDDTKSPKNVVKMNKRNATNLKAVAVVLKY